MGKHTSQDIKESIVKMYQNGNIITEISKMLQKTFSTVRDIINNGNKL